MATPRSNYFEEQHPRQIPHSASSNAFQSSMDTPSGANSAMWLPPGFKTPEAIPDGKHVCQIEYIESFTSKFNGNFIIKLGLKTTTGEEGPICITFKKDFPNDWVNKRCAILIGKILDAARVPSRLRARPDWYEITKLLREVWFKIEVASKTGGSPFILSLEPIRNPEVLAWLPHGQVEPEDPEEPTVGMEGRQDHESHDMDDQTISEEDVMD